MGVHVAVIGDAVEGWVRAIAGVVMARFQRQPERRI